MIIERLSRSVSRYSRNIGRKIKDVKIPGIAGLIILILIYLMSGGMITSLSAKRTIGVRTLSPTIFTQYFIILATGAVGAFLIYNGVKGSKIDEAQFGIGTILLIISMIAGAWITLAGG